eukprot:SAG11_NODE_518_length_8798_cov_5.156110_5_plen_197_part_00
MQPIREETQQAKLGTYGWPWAAALVHGIPSGASVEVAHACCDYMATAGSNVKYEGLSTGYWFLHAPGSGVYYNVGKTIVFRDHADAYMALVPVAQRPLSFNMSTKTMIQTVNRKENYLFDIALAAHKLGYDSVQYTHRLEYHYIFEFQDIRDLSNATIKNTCPPPVVHAAMRGGYGGSRPCRCDNHDVANGNFLRC